VETFEVLYWKTLEKFSWTDRVRNEVLESRRRGISYVQ